MDIVNNKQDEGQENAGSNPFTSYRIQCKGSRNKTPRIYNRSPQPHTHQYVLDQSDQLQENQALNTMRSGAHSPIEDSGELSKNRLNVQ